LCRLLPLLRAEIECALEKEDDRKWQPVFQKVAAHVTQFTESWIEPPQFLS
jgi:hypothetical protein